MGALLSTLNLHRPEILPAFLHLEKSHSRKRRQNSYLVAAKNEIGVQSAPWRRRLRKNHPVPASKKSIHSGT
jgi:hypothetical protein